MRKRLVKFLKCPNTGNTDFSVYGKKILRDEVVFENINDQDCLEEDDIIEGIIFSPSGLTAYPITTFIAVLLSNNDVDAPLFTQLLKPYLGNSSDVIHSAVEHSIESINKQNETSHGKWNREEMKYYDEEVNTLEKRNVMVKSIKTNPIWRIFLPRERYIIRQLSTNTSNKHILEIGSGNSRTVANLFSPNKFHYNYVGTDVSFNRLQVAKTVIPEGDFIQASALNLPFVNNSFDALISFGMLHHLPDTEIAITGCTSLLKTGGLLAFHEPINRPVTKYPGSDKFKKMVTTYEHSAHDGKINFNQVNIQLKELKFISVSVVLKNTIVRATIESFLKKIMNSFMYQKPVIRFMEIMDDLVLNSLSNISIIFAPGTVYAVFKKTSK